jgi:hypothetical protein
MWLSFFLIISSLIGPFKVIFEINLQKYLQQPEGRSNSGSVTKKGFSFLLVTFFYKKALKISFLNLEFTLKSLK